MKFDLCSDLHLSFGGYKLLESAPTEGTKVLVMAGDTLEVVALKTSSNEQRHMALYLQNLNDHYDLVIYIMGNHEHYGNSFIHTKQNLVTQFKKLNLNHFVVLEKEMYEYEDVIFFGATLWTTFRNRNPLSMNTAQSYMNDYREIHVGPGAYQDKLYLTTNDTAIQCEMTKRKIAEFASLTLDKKKVLVTHMAPCSLSVGPEYASSLTNDAYYEDISELLMDSDIKVAVHGHIHEPVDYMLDNCRVVSNPRGYHGHESQTNSYGFKMIEV